MTVDEINKDRDIEGPKLDPPEPFTSGKEFAGSAPSTVPKQSPPPLRQARCNPGIGLGN